MKDAKRMIESSMQSPWIYEIRESQLTNPSQALKYGAAYNFNLFALKLDEPMNRIADF
jgi:hypothetical protein